MTYKNPDRICPRCETGYDKADGGCPRCGESMRQELNAVRLGCAIILAVMVVVMGVASLLAVFSKGGYR